MDLTSEMIQVDYNGEKTNMEKFVLKLSIPEENASGDTSLIGGLLTFFEDGLYGGYKIDPVEGEDDHLTLVPVIDLNKLMGDGAGGSSTQLECPNHRGQILIRYLT